MTFSNLSIQIINKSTNKLAFYRCLLSHQTNISRKFVTGRNNGSFTGCVELWATSSSKNLFQPITSQYFIQHLKIKNSSTNIKTQKVSKQRESLSIA